MYSLLILRKQHESCISESSSTSCVLERTDKIPMGSIKAVVSEPIEGHEEYHLMVSDQWMNTATEWYQYSDLISNQWIAGDRVASQLMKFSKYRTFFLIRQNDWLMFHSICEKQSKF